MFEDRVRLSQFEFTSVRCLWSDMAKVFEELHNLASDCASGSSCEDYPGAMPTPCYPNSLDNVMKLKTKVRTVNALTDGLVQIISKAEEAMANG